MFCEVTNIIYWFNFRCSARRVYVGGLLIYCTGMMLMAVTKHRVGVILFSWTAGVMYSTLFTMPYLLIAHYHAKGTVSNQMLNRFNIMMSYESGFQLNLMAPLVRKITIAVFIRIYIRPQSYS